MSIFEALNLSILLLQEIQRAKLAGQETIEIDRLGQKFAAVNAAIQAARGPDPED